tara:strand:+ start:3169 stop:3648 length:480 start_codon:yes stop_codon:yes gene_type:complete
MPNYYYLKNREKMREYQREYQKKYLSDPVNKQKKKDYMKEYQKTYQREYYRRNPEKHKQYCYNWIKNNPERAKAYWEKYRKTDKSKKLMRIANWKQIGIIDADLSAVYDIYIKEEKCWICGSEFLNNKCRHLDHDHETGEIRYICCQKCNCRLLRNNQN